MQRRAFLAGAAALAVAGCAGSGGTSTIAEVIAELKKQCTFVPELDSIIRVITTLVTGFNAEAGAATIIASSIAKQVVDMVCNAVKAQRAQMQVDKKAIPTDLTVIVNGVQVRGKNES